MAELSALVRARRNAQRAQDGVVNGMLETSGDWSFGRAGEFMRRNAMRWMLVAATWSALSGLAAADDPNNPTTGAEETAPAEDPWRNEFLRFDLGGILNFYTSAVEVSTSGESNRRLTTDMSGGFVAAATWRVWGPFAVGVYAQFEAGERSFGHFSEVRDGVAIVEGDGGGGFRELWFGPLLRFQWKSVFAEVGWGPAGFRWDSARTDLPAGGAASGAFRTTPSIAWLLGIGTAVEIWGDFELVLRLNYRIRYYEVRGGRDLDEGLAHGTQDIIPFIGLAWAVERTGE